MSDYADADLVTAVIRSTDHLKARAQARLRQGRLQVPFSVGIELLFVAEKHGLQRTDVITTTALHFDLERADVLATAAKALDRKRIKTVFDAIHAATALADGKVLVTTDRNLLDSGFPTAAF